MDAQSACEWKSIEIRATFVDLLTQALMVGSAAMPTPDTLMARAAAITTDSDRRSRRYAFGVAVTGTPVQN